MIIIALTGVMTALLGLVLLFATGRSFLEENMRFFLPIPPLGVAAHVYVFNFCKKCLDVPDVTAGMIIHDAAVSTVYAAGIFFVFIAPLLFFVYLKEFR
jgi:hypothetical protein